MMIIIHFICMSLVYHFSFFLTNFKSVICCHFCHNFFKQSKNYINFHFQFLSAPALEIKDNNNQLWQQNKPSFYICWSIGKKKYMKMSINNQSKTTLINYIYSKKSICHHIVNKSEQGEDLDFESCMLYCYTLVKLNKSVQPIALQNTNFLRSGLTIGIGALRYNFTHTNIREILLGSTGLGSCPGISNRCTLGLSNQQAGS